MIRLRKLHLCQIGAWTLALVMLFLLLLSLSGDGAGPFGLGIGYSQNWAYVVPFFLIVAIFVIIHPRRAVPRAPRAGSSEEPAR